MRACARVALASIAVSASISLSGCAAIEELKDARHAAVARELLDELPEATPTRFHRRKRRRSQASGPHSRNLQRANCNGRALCFLQRNRRSPIPPRR